MTRITACRSCGREVVWLATATGRRMPVNADTVKEDDAVFDPKAHTSHFADCPQADAWRKRRGAPAP